MRWYPIYLRLDDWLDARRRAKSVWHNWFAWYPVTASMGKDNKVQHFAIWLESVQRQRVVTDMTLFWYYRIKGE